MKISLYLGANAPKLKEQLDNYEITGYDNGDIELLQKDADAISRLSIRGFISESVAIQARKRLMKKIAKWLEEGLK